MGKQYDVVALGELLIDFACVSSDADGYPTLAAHPGGAPANYLAVLAKYGKKAAFLGKVGRDTFGQLLAKTLQAAGIDTSGLCMDEDFFTTLAFVTFDPDGNRNFSFARKPGADTQLKSEELDLDMLKSTRVFHFGTLSLTDEPSRSATLRAVRCAKENGALISYDPNYRAPLWRSEAEAKEQLLQGLALADVVKISDEEVEFLFGLSPEEGAEKIRQDFGAKLVFVTLGSKGCLYSNANVTGTVPGLSGVKAIDTTGAGDIFGGSAMFALLNSGKAPEALNASELQGIASFAVRVSGLSVTKQGGIPSIPALGEVLGNA